MSLRTRIALLVGVTVLLASAIGSIGTTVSSRSVGIDSIDGELIDDADSFVIDSPRLAAQLQFALDARQGTCDTDTDTDTVADPEPEATTRPNRPRQIRATAFASSMQAVRPDGTVFVACTEFPISDEQHEIARAGSGTNFDTVSVEGEQFRMLTRGMGDIGAVQFARSIEFTENTLRTLVIRSIIFGVIGAICAGAVGWLFAKRVTDPVARLSETAERVAHTHDLGERISVEGASEIGALASSFNAMLSSLDTSREQQQRLVQDTSHELRTPLTSMRTNVELLLRHDDMDPDVRSEVLDDISSELGELTQLTTELVDSATEVPTSLQFRDEIDLPDLVAACVDRARRRHHRTVNIEIAGDNDSLGSVYGDHALVTRAVTNLLNNAVKFSDSDTEISVEVSANQLTVCDQGPGVPVDDLPYIFDRFYRATAARSAPGSGLGLAIVHQIVVGHGGTVSAENAAEGGARIGFSLPVVAPAQTN